MKIIFSRKGFDSGYGGVASPIFPDGKMMSLPIPGASYTRYRDVHCECEDMSKLLEDLTKNKVQGRMPTHFDPDLNPKSLKRLEGWTPSLGQTGAAQSHLDSKGVGEGDLFLFFGWFRQAEKKEEKWRFVPGSKDLHVLLSYHNDPTRWTQLEDGSHTLQSVAKGQEFIIDCEKIVGAKEWAHALIHKHLILEQKKTFVKTI